MTVLEKTENLPTHKWQVQAETQVEFLKPFFFFNFHVREYRHWTSLEVVSETIRIFLPTNSVIYIHYVYGIYMEKKCLKFSIQKVQNNSSTNSFPIRMFNSAWE